MNSIEFADLARQLGDATRAAGHDVPAFRSPPRRAGVRRTITRRGGSALISVAIRHRPATAVAADLIEGIVVANDLRGEPAAGALRDELWATAEAVIVSTPETVRHSRTPVDRQLAA
ncbi:MAG: hypothetical protein ACRBI6_15295 [Acidimicrobiales bacterium]